MLAETWDFLKHCFYSGEGFYFTDHCISTGVMAVHAFLLSCVLGKDPWEQREGKVKAEVCSEGGWSAKIHPLLYHRWNVPITGREEV